MEDSGYSRGPTDSPSPFRWIIFAISVILGVIGLVGVGMFYPVDLATILLVFYIPTVLLFLWMAYRWAQGREIVHTDELEDDRILSSMRKHALPVQFLSGTDTLQCPDCQHKFNLMNALPVQDEIGIILCPNCGTRLHIPDI
jgi:hypothetical protein